MLSRQPHFHCMWARSGFRGTKESLVEAGIFTKIFIKEKWFLGSYLCTHLFTGKKECQGTLPDTEAGKKLWCAPSRPYSRCIKPFRGWNVFLKGRFIGCTMIVQTCFNLPVKDSKYRAPLTVKTWPLLGITQEVHYLQFSLLFCVLTTWYVE